MLVRCQLDDSVGLIEMLRCRAFAEAIGKRGYEISYAIPKDGYEAARLFLGPKASINRLPLETEGELSRLSHLQKQGGHQILFLNHPNADSAYLFELKRRFRYLILWNPQCSGPIYADLIIQSAIDERVQVQEAAPGSKLLLGPKFHLGIGRQFPSKAALPVHAILLHLGGAEEATLRVLQALALLGALPPITIYGPRSSYLRRKLAAFQLGHPHLQLLEALPNTLQPFPFADFNFAICSADLRTLDLAGLGLFFLNLPLTPVQVRDGYQLEHWGISPCLGVIGAKSDETLASIIRTYLLEPETRLTFVEQGLRWIDGLGAERISRFAPPEKALAVEPLESGDDFFDP